MTPGGYGILIAAALLLGASIGWRLGFSAGRADAERLLDSQIQILGELCEKLEEAATPEQQPAKEGGAK